MAKIPTGYDAYSVLYDLNQDIAMGIESFLTREGTAGETPELVAFKAQLIHEAVKYFKDAFSE